MTERVLSLHVKAQYFDEIKAGKKLDEFREDNAHWQRRLLNREFDQVCILWGYPRADVVDRRLWFKWRGFVRTSIIHPHFGNRLTAVFAIDLRDPLNG